MAEQKENIPGRLRDLTGKRFGRLLVLHEDGRDRWRGVHWRCICDCGSETRVRSGNLVRGATRSCGCGVLISVRRPRSHGLADTRIYHCWQNMKARCGNPNRRDYKHYGGRGIAVCARWLESFENFLNDMPGYAVGAEIDRIDNDGNYEPGNCRWASRTIQQRNRRSNHRITVCGRTLTIAEWGEVTGLKPNTILVRVRRGWSGERLLEPLK